MILELIERQDSCAGNIKRASYKERAGKTAIIRQLELDGFSVVEEAATELD
jgi:hypothetical protein